MRMTNVVAALRSWVERLWLFASTTLSRVGEVSPISSPPVSEPVNGTVDAEMLDQSGPQAEDSLTQASGQLEGLNGNYTENGLHDDKQPPIDSNTTSVESNLDAEDQLSPVSTENGPDKSPTVVSPTGDDSEQTQLETIDKPGDGGADGISESGASEANSQKKTGPHRSGGKRGTQSGRLPSGQQKSPSNRPELVCRKNPSSAGWEVILITDEKAQLDTVFLDGRPLDFSDGRCRIPSLDGCLTVSYRDGQEHVVPLFESEPLIFKLPKYWSGEGRRTTGITSGYFIVFAPSIWQRTGHAPVEADGCADPEFRAHYFHRDAFASEGVDGFRESEAPFATGIELTGRRIFDDSKDGELFVGDPPDMKSPPELAWARVGEETGSGWGENFKPQEQSLSKVLGRRRGRFFLRVYDSEVSMLDSLAFRHLPNLRQICVNGAEYAPDTVLVPGLRGYPPMDVSFVSADSSTLSPVLPTGARQKVLPSGAIEVPPHPDADRIECRFGSDARGVNIVVDLPRIWWRLDGRTDPGPWRDTPLVMTREEFRKQAHSDATISLLSKRQVSVCVGFGDELNQPYRRTIEDDRIVVPLDHFVDHAQIDRRLNADACFNVQWAREIVSLIVISADPMPEIVSFTAEPATIFVGEETVLEWTSRNAGDARVAMIPDAGVLKVDGSCTVRPAETTTYTLILDVLGADEVSRTVTVAVVSPTTSGKQTVPRVMSTASGWRTGKGFSFGELKEAGLSLKEAVDRSIPIDRRRRTLHRTNVETIGRMLDA